MKVPILLLTAALLSSAAAADYRLIEPASKGFIHLQREDDDGDISDRFINLAQIAAIHVDSEKNENNEHWMTIKTTASDSGAQSVSIPFKTRKEALDAADRLMASMTKAGKSSDNVK